MSTAFLHTICSSHGRLIFTKCNSVMVSLMIKYILFYNTKATKLKLIKGDSKKYCYGYHNDMYGNVINEVSTCGG